MSGVIQALYSAVNSASCDRNRRVPADAPAAAAVHAVAAPRIANVSLAQQQAALTAALAPYFPQELIALTSEYDLALNFLGLFRATAPFATLDQIPEKPPIYAPLLSRPEDNGLCVPFFTSEEDRRDLSVPRYHTAIRIAERSTENVTTLGIRSDHPNTPLVLLRITHNPFFLRGFYEEDGKPVVFSDNHEWLEREKRAEQEPPLLMPLDYAPQPWESRVICTRWQTLEEFFRDYPAFKAEPKTKIK